MNESKVSNSSKDYDHILKIIIVGDSSVGKSNIFKKFCFSRIPD